MTRQPVYAAYVRLYNTVTGQSLPESQSSFNSIGGMAGLLTTLAESGNFEKTIALVWDKPDLKRGLMAEAVAEWCERQNCYSPTTNG